MGIKYIEVEEPDQIICIQNKKIKLKEKNIGKGIGTIISQCINLILVKKNNSNNWKLNVKKLFHQKFLKMKHK